ncbi:MAG TPA: c-type cytochrome, partial [Dongiaceae bacterium]
MMHGLLRHAWPILMLCLLGACRADQSVFSPHGPRAAQITHLAWLLFGLGAVVLALVIVAAWQALRGSKQMRAYLASGGAVIAGGIVFPAVTLTALLGYGVWTMGAEPRASAAGDVQRIEIVGEQWWWRIAYRKPDGSLLASANEVRIPVAREVEFMLKSSDVIHSFWVPALNGKVDMIPGRVTQLRVIADRPGVFRGQCAEYCGGPHALMALPVIAMPGEEFQQWLTRASDAAPAPAGAIEQRGQSLFLASGCGACHTIRGTRAGGVIGPDLSQFGARRSVGI